MDKLIPRVQQKLQTLPTSPGVYVFRGKGGAALYIGKARNLRSRVRSYFQRGTSDTRAFIRFLGHEIADLETLIVATEKEAAILESQLIKEQQPRYNIKLRDDKSFLSLRLDPKEAWPRLRVVRRPKADKAYYFGPYPSASEARKTLSLINRHFQLRTCRDAEFARRTRPCLQYQIKRCPAPCVLASDRSAYGEDVENVRLFLQGKQRELGTKLREKMQSAATAMDFERAAKYRDQIRAVENIQEKQRIKTVQDKDQDIIGFFRKDEKAEVAVVTSRAGTLVQLRTFALDGVALPSAELISSFVASYYGDDEGYGRELPDEVLLPLSFEAMEGVADSLSERRGKKVKLRVPKRAPGTDLLRLATENAAHAYEEKAREKEGIESRLGEVMRILRLPHLPRHIECIDISHTHGEDPVACIVALRDGSPFRKAYKSFRVKNAKGGDDFASIYEVLKRRLARHEQSKWSLPDLLLIDGGPGQLAMAIAARKDTDTLHLPVASIAKERVQASGDAVSDRIYLPGQKNAIPLHRHRALTMLALARDEAHRASNELRMRRRRKRMTTSTLDQVAGIGPKTKQKLLTHLGSLEAIRTASTAELLSAGASKVQARAIYDFFRSAPPSS